jgi:hypothetical protein
MNANCLHDHKPLLVQGEGWRATCRPHYWALLMPTPVVPPKTLRRKAAR